MKRVLPTLALLALLAGGQARGSLVLVAGPNQGTFTTNNFGFGADGTGSTANPTASYFVGGKYGSHLDNAPVAYLFVVGDNGALSTYYDSKVGPYDDNEDTQIAVLNLQHYTSLTSLTLHGPAGIADFDGDGISGPQSNPPGQSTFGAAAPSNSFDKSNGLYGGPMTYFSTTVGGPSLVTDGSLKTVIANFINGGVTSGTSTYFSLEGAPSDLSGIVPTGSTSVPEPSSIVTFAIGLLGSVATLSYRSRRHKTAV